MFSNDQINDKKLKEALEINRLAAEKGKDSFFNNWWFFDTNCISELVKLWEQGFAEEVHTFVNGKDILITSTLIQELKEAPRFLEVLSKVLEKANLFSAFEIDRFWYTDILNFLNSENRIPINSLNTYPIPGNFFEEVIHNQEVAQAISEASKDVEGRFFRALKSDIGSNFDERDLCIHIFSVVSKYGKLWFKIDIPPADANSGNFPSFFVFFYAYYFRFVKGSNVTPELNDYIDLANTIVAPYCQRYYAEKKFAIVLKNYVQNRQPPSAFRLAKLLYKKGIIDATIYRNTKGNREKLGVSEGMLPQTKIFNLTELREQILSGTP